MGVNAVGRAEDDIDAAAIGLPSRDAGRKTLSGISDAAIVLFLKFVLHGVRRGVAAKPKLFNELVALFIVGELLEGGHFFVADDPADIILQPLLVGIANFLLEILGVSLLLFRRDLA